MQDQIDRAKALLKKVRHAAMATVNADGTPHNTPFHYIIDSAKEHLYWASGPETVHQQNLARTGQAFIVIYEPGTGGGLYLQGVNAHELTGAELEQGLEVWNAKRAEEGRGPLTTDFFGNASPQHMCRVDLVKFWVNHSERDGKGNIIRDVRTEISREDLIE